MHLHSRYSDDGEVSPAELVARCAAHGVTAMSVTDHNCARANAEARPLAEACGIRYLDGIEIDCVFQSLEFHVLGYGSGYHGKTKPAVRLTACGDLPDDFSPEELLAALTC